MKTNKVISLLTAGLVLFLAGAAFVLSYDALHALALENGIDESLAWLWPLTLDAVMIAATLSVLRAGLNQESTWYAWALVVVFTMLSVTFNVLHADATWLARAVFSLPPLVVFLSFELLMAQVKNAATRNTELVSIDDLDARRQQLAEQVDDLDVSIEQKTNRVNALRVDIKELGKAKRASGTEAKSGFPMPIGQAREARANGKQAAMDALVDYLAVNPNASLAEAGEAIDRSKTTVASYMTELEKAGRIDRNGNGSAPTIDPPF